ncbi:DNA cytosine methyltransferase [Nocardia sp. 852002-51244_SCH5132740]|uniref:DNA cytosine methyltransferase n=1 Tax=Nocardia sp. 852002-51244_SCH5132740 TaxID=1834099 RepID=UPI0007E9647F|nr:DNA cytosine methyltransferase [Nocardia sp. 852002-51244_SCH5132740]OBB38720.1 hypothetical protein A5748_02300 [Nocardia sp. 852002-51244_SCH5132740]
MSLRSTVFFAGWGGDSLGWDEVPDLELGLAGNHDETCTKVHTLNFPRADHLPPGDVEDIDLATLPYTEMFWASPACPDWTDAAGRKRYFDQSNQYTFDEQLGVVIEDPSRSRSRALIEQIPRYLKAMAARGTPVLAGAMENVIQCRNWDKWDAWKREIEEIGPGYNVRVIALNSAHVRPRRCRRAPQSRNRLYVAYSLKSLGRVPDWDKWLRPQAYCPTCDRVVDAVQSWKQPGADMGRYGVRTGQYVYRCPAVSCRYAIVEPLTAPASEAIDWSLPAGEPIGERTKPLQPATLDRVRIGLRRFGAAPAAPFVVQTSKRASITAHALDRPGPTQTTRRELGLAIPPFITLLRGGGSKKTAHPLTAPLSSFSAKGFHHGLVQAPATETVRAEISDAEVEKLLPQCTFRMLEPPEIRDGMAFPVTYKPIGSRRTQARGYGNAVTPPAAEVIGCALVEAITGIDIERTVAA